MKPFTHKNAAVLVALLALSAMGSFAEAADLAVRGEKIYTVAGEPIENGVVLIRDGKIAGVGTAES